ncbi:pentatricopeptide repeat-containing protein At5g65560-like [Musa acuminata AAA Group]|uniref:pentatricopeptide repeat-containing protein At5g65560-like n=1 Tax=Musa acuminata AAA Group TaxID=214697 RepID=UPI0031E2A840
MCKKTTRSSTKLGSIERHPQWAAATTAAAIGRTDAALRTLALFMHGGPIKAVDGSRLMSAVACEAFDWARSSPSRTDDEKEETEEVSSSRDGVSKDPSTPGEELHVKFSEAVLRFSRSGRASVREVSSRPARFRAASYNKLMKAVAEVGSADDVLRLFGEMKRSECQPNVLCYSTVINALLTAGRHEEAEATFEEMIFSGIKPNLFSYNILVKLHACCTKKFDLAYEVIAMVKKRGLCPDSTTYSTLITGLCSAGRIEEAWGVLDWMLEENCPPTTHSYTPIVQSYCFEGKIEPAKSLMATMVDVGCTPSTATYNILIGALCRAGNFDEVEKILTESVHRGWKPNEITYNTYMDGLCKSGRTKEAFDQLEVMLGIGLYPTAFTLNILLNCLCCDSKEVLVAKCLIERSSELHWYVSVVDYNVVMSGLRKAGHWVGVIKLFTDMVKKGITPNIRTFNIVIHSLCHGGKLHMAVCMMNSGEIIANVVTYNTLLHWFYLDGRINEAQHLFSFMSANNISPDGITYNTMIDSLCRVGRFLEATDCFIRSLEYRFSTDLLLRLIHRLVRNRRLKELLKLFKGIEKHSISLDVLVFDSLIKAACKEGFCGSTEIYVLCLILDKMLARR